MKKNLNKSMIALYVAIVVLAVFVSLLIDKTGNAGYKVALSICLLGLVIVICAYHLENRKPKSLADNVSEDSYAVINKDVYAIKVDKEDKENVTIKLTRKN